jgi:hypothetical protein
MSDLSSGKISMFKTYANLESTYIRLKIVRLLCYFLNNVISRGGGRDADHSPPSSADVKNE